LATMCSWLRKNTGRIGNSNLQPTSVVTFALRKNSEFKNATGCQKLCAV
jgi:hypothetical protein